VEVYSFHSDNIQPEPPTKGCTDPEALNYNPEATIDDGSCTYPEPDIEGCTDSEALNYNPEATIDDESCTYPEPISTDTGWKSLTATGGNYNQFTTTGNAYSSNNEYDTLDLPVSNSRQSYEDFNFGVPDGATINGIEVSIEHYESAAQDGLRRVYVYSSHQLGSYFKSFTPKTTEGTQVLGGPSDLWDLTWDSDAFSNANFYTAPLVGATTTGTYYLDHIQVKVYYTQ
ncbi:hypothetical protein KA005_72175, partial [bacterium]|nr:hypothetical protein [bacterium]